MTTPWFLGIWVPGTSMHSTPRCPCSSRSPTLTAADVPCPVPPIPADLTAVSCAVSFPPPLALAALVLDGTWRRGKCVPLGCTLRPPVPQWVSGACPQGRQAHCPLWPAFRPWVPCADWGRALQGVPRLWEVPVVALRKLTYPARACQVPCWCLFRPL